MPFNLFKSAHQDRVEKEKLDSFYLPLYCPSVDELKELVCQNELLDITNIRLFEINGNPNEGSDQSAEDGAAAPVVIHGAAATGAAGKTISTSLRAVREPLIASHFGDSILSEVEKSFIPVNTLSLKAKH
uniref:Uncharacterized protein n=1 Tax=Oryza meridionalis TaxID=40149 RepID=A0A0E0F4E4_9ORYZ